MVAFPAALPQSPLLQGLDFTRLTSSVIFEPEVGESIGRRRFTGNRKTIPFVLPVCSQEQHSIFFTFYDVTLEDGNLPFTWKDFETGELNVTYVFVDPRPKAAPIAPDSMGAMQWRISATIRRMF